MDTKKSEPESHGRLVMTDALEFSGLLPRRNACSRSFFFSPGNLCQAGFFFHAVSSARPGESHLAGHASVVGPACARFAGPVAAQGGTPQIEIELVNPLPDHPLRLRYRSKEDYHAAKK